MFVAKKIYWSNGNVKRETPFYKDKRQGVEKNYDEEGVLISTVDYSDDVIDGYIKTYFKSGLVESRQLFNKGIDMHELIVYNEEGKILYSSSSDYKVDSAMCLLDDYSYKKHL